MDNRSSWMHRRASLRTGGRALLVFALACAGLACSSESAAPPELEQPLGAECNPLSRAHCLLPWPSSFYLKKDSSTVTGYRLNYPAAALPLNRDKHALDVTRYNLRDGFSGGSQPIVWLPGGFSMDGLPRLADPSSSTAVDCPIWFVEQESGKRVAFFAELDANAKGTEVPALILRPLKPLEPHTRYIVALKTSAKDAAGAPLLAPEGFARLRDGYPTADPTLEGERSRIDEVLGALEKQGLARGELALAWDFHTASRESIHGRLKAMIDEALAKLPAGGPDYTIETNVTHDVTKRPHLWRELTGTFEVPSFLAGEGDDDIFTLDADGKPKYRALQSFEFRVHVPRCAETATKPLPVMVFGHGLFSTHGELRGGYVEALADHLCMIQVATNWIGLSYDDVTAVATQIIPDFSRLPRVTDRLQQAHINQHALVELVQGKLPADPALAHNGKALSDGKEIYYYGISGGGVQGFAFAGLQTKIKRFALNVGGGWWSLMMERSSNFTLLAVALALYYPAALDRLILVVTSQSIWDDADPISYAANIRDDPQKRLLLQEGVDDDSVPNVATRTLARAAALPLLEPQIQAVAGLTAAAGPLPSAYTQWHVHPPLTPPEKNVPASRPPSDQSAHNVVRQLADAVEQLRRFLRPDGQVEQTCQGKCECIASQTCVLFEE